MYFYFLKEDLVRHPASSFDPDPVCTSFFNCCNCPLDRKEMKKTKKKKEEEKRRKKTIQNRKLSFLLWPFSEKNFQFICRHKPKHHKPPTRQKDSSTPGGSPTNQNGPNCLPLCPKCPISDHFHGTLEVVPWSIPHERDILQEARGTWTTQNAS